MSKVTLNGLSRKFKTKVDMRSHPKYWGRRCLIYSGEWQQYWGPDRCGYTPYKPGTAPPRHTEAGVYDFEDAVDATFHCGPEKKIEFHFLPRPKGRPKLHCSGYGWCELHGEHGP